MTIKTCATCRFSVQPGPFAKCKSPNSAPPQPAVHPLTGFERYKGAPIDNPYCEDLRGDDENCGPEGRWWEAAE